MKKMLTTLVVGSALLISACSNQTVYLNDKAPAKLSYEENQSFFISGIGQERTVNAVEICGGEDKISKVESQLTGGNILVGLVTLGIYTPRVSRVYCQQ
ncbi:Lipoprotein [Bibersteinia trehalosi USDA-ARS-USMARC-188]|uniref:Lipoprotein n=5 Tax=Bibersteinia trehalosi TaxID=47735 RepID=W0R4I8_BIBTR|nr:Bor family protein [Bibersteinia trehalosi]AGH37468.1 Lipoprotein [Bibersteinia trehalosi USDA-ARS-USMARC-192]AHG82722.1 Lipoprotein [Bibersteinia trehalosi USDA-ARS-USMARC-188]AHG85058.1 Lipoprotein [Bibersteinia trehalosi USDA-ARS-USMARC-189]AHG85372.1 Lipoprotein [Bibersteinia trehalosi USDA-ARS-USMARC-190]OAQ13858.1 hypothetical protein F480_05455 [Bibersteinia trehalosi Y31]